MANKVLSIEIGTYLTKICIVNSSKNNVKVHRTMAFDTPSDCMEDGYIKEVHTLAEVIDHKLKEYNIDIKDVIFTVASTKIANREVNIPLVKTDKIQSVVDACAGDYFPIDVADYKIAYSILEKVNTKEDKHYRLLVLAAHNNLISTYYELASQLNLHVMNIDYTGNSVYQVLRKQLPEGIHMVVQINTSNSLINVLKNGGLELQRTIPYGFMPVSSNDRKEEDLQEETTQNLNYLINNIIRVSDYYINRNPDNKIQTIYITGMGAKHQVIEKLLSKELGINIMILDKLSCADFLMKLLNEAITESDYIACVGAVINPVGLIPKNYSEKVQIKNDIRAVAIITSLAIVTSIILAVISGNLLKDAKKDKVELTNEINDMKDIEQIYSSYMNAKEELSSIQKIDASCVKNTGNLIQLFAEMEKKLPQQATIHSYKATDADIIMDFTTDSFETAAMVMKQLKTIDLITEVSSSEVTKQSDEQGKIQVSFSVSAAFRNSIQKDQGEAK